jgi:hypothetical protein
LSLAVLVLEVNGGLFVALVVVAPVDFVLERHTL